MALYDITYINGVTKVETGDGFIYHFPLEIIETNTALNSFKRTQRGQTDSEHVQFSNLDETLGSLTVEGYADALCNSGAYSGRVDGEVLSVEDSAINTLNERILDTLERIEFFLKSIAE